MVMPDNNGLLHRLFCSLEGGRVAVLAGARSRHPHISRARRRVVEIVIVILPCASGDSRLTGPRVLRPPQYWQDGYILCSLQAVHIPRASLPPCTLYVFTSAIAPHLVSTTILDRRQAKAAVAGTWDLACAVACREPRRPMESPRLCVRSTTTCSVLAQPLSCQNFEYTLQPPDARSPCVPFRNHQREREKNSFLVCFSATCYLCPARST